MVFNVIGEKVATLIGDRRMNVGTHSVLFNASDLASGVYIYRLQTKDFILSKKMMLLKIIIMFSYLAN